MAPLSASRCRGDAPPRLLARGKHGDSFSIWSLLAGPDGRLAGAWPGRRRGEQGLSSCRKRSSPGGWPAVPTVFPAAAQPIITIIVRSYSVPSGANHSHPFACSVLPPATAGGRSWRGCLPRGCEFRTGSEGSGATGGQELSPDSGPGFSDGRILAFHSPSLRAGSGRGLAQEDGVGDRNGYIPWRWPVQR